MQDTYMVPDMPASEYHSRPEDSSGFLKTMLQHSPFHAKWKRENPTQQTPAMKFGTAWHSAFFEPDCFTVEYVTLPEGLDRRTKEGKALWAEVEASGRIVLTPDERQRIEAMTQAASEHPLTRDIINHGSPLAEPSVFSVDPSTGRGVRIRPDWLIAPCDQFPLGLIVDGKTTTDAGPDGFGKAVWNLAYHLQAALYSDVAQRLFGTSEPPPFLWLAIEKDAPYGLAYYQAGADVIERGRSDYTDMLLVADECDRNGFWPGYSTEVTPLSLPGWVKKADNDDDVAAIGYVGDAA